MEEVYNPENGIIFGFLGAIIGAIVMTLFGRYNIIESTGIRIILFAIFVGVFAYIGARVN